jgi:hypothetical protein
MCIRKSALPRRRAAETRRTPGHRAPGRYRHPTPRSGTHPPCGS